MCRREREESRTASKPLLGATGRRQLPFPDVGREWEDQVGQKVKNSSKRGLLQGSGVSEPTLKGQARLQKLWALRQCSEINKKPKGARGLSSGAAECGAANTLIVRLVNRCPGYWWESEQSCPHGSSGHGQVPSNSTSRGERGTPGRAARHRCVADVRPRHASRPQLLSRRQASWAMGSRGHRRLVIKGTIHNLIRCSSAKHLQP